MRVTSTDKIRQLRIFRARVWYFRKSDADIIEAVGLNRKHASITYLASTLIKLVDELFNNAYALMFLLKNKQKIGKHYG